MARGSEITADVYRRRIRRLEKRYGFDPFGVLRQSDEEIHGAVIDIVTKLEREGKTGSYIHSVVKAVKSWLLFNGKVIMRPIKIVDADDAPTLRDEVVPQASELHKVIVFSSPKNRVSSFLMAHGGVRPGAIGDYRGFDGLRLRDLPDLEVGGGGAAFSVTPAQLIVRRSLSKAGHQYFTFLSDEACGYVADYLEARMRGGESLTPDSPLVTPEKTEKPFIRTTNIGDGIREGIRAAGFDWRPYVLRCYFDTQLLLAESKGRVIRDYRVFWMGHKGDMEHRYTTNKQQLPPDLLEDMRASYRRCEEYLRTFTGGESSEERFKREVWRQLLIVSGVSTLEVDALGELSGDVVAETFRRRLGGVGKPAAQAAPVQRVVATGEAAKYLSGGWRFVAKLTEGEVIVEGGGVVMPARLA